MLLGRIEVVAGRRGDQLLDRRRLVGSLCTLLLPGDVAAKARGDAGEQVGELVVIDQGRRSLALDHVRELGPGEGGVQIEGDRAELRAGHRRLDEVAVVAAHDRDPVSFTDPLVAKRPGERVRAAVGLGPGELTGLVDHGDFVRMADRTGRAPQRGRGAPMEVALADPDGLVGAHRPQDPGLHEDPGLENAVGDLS
jgi:hypothetical protein